MNGYEKRTKEKKEAIVAVAKKLFFQQGVTQTSIADIAKEAKVSQVTIYNYFGSKNALLINVMRQYMTSALQSDEALFLEDIPFREKMEKAIERKQSKAAEMSAEFFATIPWSDPDMQSLYQEMRSKSHDFSKKMFDQGIEEGVFHHSITFEAYLDYISAIDSIITSPEFIKRGDVYRAGIERLVWYGLLGK